MSSIFQYFQIKGLFPLSKYTSIVAYNQHVHYERIRYSRLRHLLIIPLIAWIILYFTFPLIPDFLKLPVGVKVEAKLEKFLFFGFLPHTILDKIHNPVFDILCAIPYTLHIFNPFIFIACCFTFLKQRITIMPYVNSLGVLNILGMCIQLIFPTAPPWYYDKYGFLPASYDMKGDPAGLSRVDELLGIEFYHNSFDQNKVVFGSFPSLHVAWATLMCLFICSWDGWKKLKWFIRGYVALLCFAVVYLQHHYVLDVFFGLGLAYFTKKIVPMPVLSITSTTTTTTTTTTSHSLHHTLHNITTSTIAEVVMVPMDTFSAQHEDYKDISIEIETPLLPPSYSIEVYENSHKETQTCSHKLQPSEMKPLLFNFNKSEDSKKLSPNQFEVKFDILVSDEKPLAQDES